MKKKGTEDLENDFDSDEEMYANYDAYKALLDAGVSKTDALSRTGLTAQILKDLEAEEEEEEFKGEFKDAWYSDDDDEKSSSWEEKDDFDGDVEDFDDSDDAAFEDSGDFDDSY